MQMEVFENMEGSFEIKRRSWETRMTQNGKKESHVGSYSRLANIKKGQRIDVVVKF